jgi:hypothetical protein
MRTPFKGEYNTNFPANYYALAQLSLLAETDMGKTQR